MYSTITIEGVTFEIKFKKEEPEYEGAFMCYPGDIEIYNLEIAGVDVHDLLLNEAPALLEKIKTELLNQ